MDRLARKIKKMRQTGLEAHGEFGPENLAFKILRTQGKLKELHDARIAAKDRELSLKERRQPHSVFTYGFKHEESQQHPQQDDYRSLFKPSIPKTQNPEKETQFKRPQDYEWFKQQQAKKKTVGIRRCWHELGWCKP
jgi:hypothetical protein